MQILVPHSQQADRADIGQEYIPLRIDREDGLELVCSPQQHLDAVTHVDHIIGIELRPTLPGECAGKQVRAEDIAVEID